MQDVDDVKTGVFPANAMGLLSDGPPFIRWFIDIAIGDIPLVGGKNASLGVLYRELKPVGINVPNGFAITASAYKKTLAQSSTAQQIASLLHGLNIEDVTALNNCATKVRKLITDLPLPAEVEAEITEAYQAICQQYGENADVAVRSSATAEDLPEASFAGQQDTYLNIRGIENVLAACKRCYASLFTSRAIAYRTHHGFDHLAVALSVGVQKMVRSDLACAGVMFSIDTESGFRDAVLISGAFGLGENVVQGAVNPDEYYVFKPTLRKGFRPIIGKNIGAKHLQMVYADKGPETTKNIPVAPEKSRQSVLTDDEVLTLANWACAIEEHYSVKAGKVMPMDMEWAKDGQSGELFILQARPETVISRKDENIIKQYRLIDDGPVIVSGRAVGQQIGNGPAHVIRSAKDIEKFVAGEVLVTENTDPDWEPIMKRAAAIVTDKGGRTSHAAIISRELGIPCIVGTSNGTSQISTGEHITVSCADGHIGNVYRGQLRYDVKEISLTEVPQTRTKLAMNVGNPDSAFEFAHLPHDGVGLARLEFIISAAVQVHPRALVEYDKLTDPEAKKKIDELTFGYADRKEYFVDTLARGVGKIAAAFYPKPVVVRLSDFKSNEYANLIGGRQFEPQEENPMIGWRGASRYYKEGYKAGFALECKAMLRVRAEFGLKNVVLMVPFCRTVDEAKKVIAVMRENGLVQGEDGLKIYGMCEVPSNVILADQFLDVFDGFSIGSNDLTQLTLGLDRDSELVSDIFDERNEAVKSLIRQVIEVANRKGKYIGICGDAPSTFPEFAQFLIETGIGSMSLSPDALLKTRLAVAELEKQIKKS